jgi:hypothetical protein
MGGFKASFTDAENQIIPTAWIREAQSRWTERPPMDVPMCAIGVDPSGGGTDPMVLAPRHDGWFAKPIVVAAKTIPQDKIGSFTAARVVTERRDRALIVLDMGGGYGSACFGILRENEIDVYPYKGAEKSSRRTSDKQLGFFNVRSEALWRCAKRSTPTSRAARSSRCRTTPSSSPTSPLRAWTCRTPASRRNQRKTSASASGAPRTRATP